MAHVPYGYRIEKGIAIIDEHRGAQIKELFQAYLEGVGLQTLAARTGFLGFMQPLPSCWKTGAIWGMVIILRWSMK